jgi:hypothetical protein
LARLRNQGGAGGEQRGPTAQLCFAKPSWGTGAPLLAL